ncbi:MAG: VWA domain-containing protein [Candidatus Brachytrichaceae bacterium NZ_4S206]|jgi:hypothetical protein
MNGFDDLARSGHSAVRAAGCRLIGCIALALALMAALCALAAFGALALVRPAYAEPPQRYLLFVDQSGSVATYTPTRTLARDITQAFVRELRLQGDAEDTLELVFFGAQPRPVISPTRLSDAQLDARILEAFARSYALGGTRFDLAFALALERGQAGDVVIVISDGVPEIGAPLVGQTRQAHVAMLKRQAEQFAARRIPLFLCLLNREPPEWSALWSGLAGLTGGTSFVVRDATDARQAAQMVVAAGRIVEQATPTLTPTASPSATETPVPSMTPSATPSPVPTTSMPTSTSAAASSVVQTTPAPTAVAVLEAERASRFDPSALALACLAGLGSVCALAFVAILGGFVVARRGLARAHAAMSHTPADEGCLEIYDPETDVVQRVELRSHAVGEVLTLGRAPGCTIRLDADPSDAHGASGCAFDSFADGSPLPAVAPVDAAYDDVPMAALVLAPDGPRLESRGAPLYFDGRSVRQHLLFDNDVLYLDRFVLYYHNFFRQRAVDEPDEL